MRRRIQRDDTAYELPALHEEREHLASEELEHYPPPDRPVVPPRLPDLRHPWPLRVRPLVR